MVLSVCNKQLLHPWWGINSITFCIISYQSLDLLEFIRDKVTLPFPPNTYNIMNATGRFGKVVNFFYALYKDCSSTQTCCYDINKILLKQVLIFVINIFLLLKRLAIQFHICFSQNIWDKIRQCRSKIKLHVPCSLTLVYTTCQSN